MKPGMARLKAIPAVALLNSSVSHGATPTAVTSGIQKITVISGSRSALKPRNARSRPATASGNSSATSTANLTAIVAYRERGSISSDEIVLRVNS